MSRTNMSELKPFLSVLVVIVTLFSLVFIKMEVRRLGYEVLRDSREYNELQDVKRAQVIRLAKITQPERVRSLALSYLTLNEAERGQIIHLSGQKIALRQ